MDGAHSTQDWLGKALRGAAFSALGAGALTFLYFLTHPSEGEPPPPEALNDLYAPMHAVGIAGQMLFLVAITGLFVVQARAVRTVGLVGYISLMLGAIFIIGTLWGDGFFSPVLAKRAPDLIANPGDLYDGPLFVASAIAYVPYVAGFVLFGISSFRAALLPRDGILALTIGGLGLLVPPEPITSVPWWFFIGSAAIMAAGLWRLGIDLLRAPQLREVTGRG